MDGETVTLIDDATGERQRLRLVEPPELKLSLTTALLIGSAMTGTLRKGRDVTREAIAADILASFTRSGYRVLGQLPDLRPMPEVYMGRDPKEWDDKP